MKFITVPAVGKVSFSLTTSNEIKRSGSTQPLRDEDVFFGVYPLTGNWETMAVKAEVWVEAVTKGGRRFMAAWRQEGEDAARHRQEKREATRLGKLQSHTEA